MAWKKIAIGGAAALGAFAAIALLGAFRAHGGLHGRDPAEVAAMVSTHLDDALDDLDATPAQRQSIHAIADRLVADAMKLRGERAGTHRELVAQWDADQPDAAKLHALVDQRVEEMRKLAHEAVDAGVEVHGILTPDQRAQLTKKIERWHR